MIEISIIEYLISQNMADGQVYAEVPENPPDRYVVIQKTASGMEDGIESAMVAVQSISKSSLLDAMTLNESVKQAMLRMAETEDGIYSCTLNSDYNYTDADTKEYRYQAVFNLHF